MDCELGVPEFWVNPVSRKAKGLGCVCTSANATVGFIFTFRVIQVAVILNYIILC